MSNSLSNHFLVKVIRTVLLKAMGLLLILEDKLTYCFFLSGDLVYARLQVSVASQMDLPEEIQHLYQFF